MPDIAELLKLRLPNIQRLFPDCSHPLHAAIRDVLLVSTYAGRHIDCLQQLMNDDSCLNPLDLNDYTRLLHEQVALDNSHFPRALRRFRHYHFLRLMLREQAGLASTEDTLLAWSDFADAVILHALAWCQQELSLRYGQARDANGMPVQLYVLAMGKLGGRELNYSSDVDLIMVISSSGYTDGKESQSNEQYFTRVVQSFIQVLQNISEDGFVFRVDLRLRPNGDSGALVSSLAAMETYYQEQGRDWERYAMVKARVLGSTPDWFHSLISAFTYRRYVDFSVIESLRSMKSMIEREIQRNPRLDDIKRGLGGIREIEFIVQNVQLIRGGRIPSLRQQSLLQALEAVHQEKLLPKTAALRQAYLFLRRLENCLQSENDQQTHSLPADPERQAQIAYAMGYESWEALMNRLQQYRRIISYLFHAVLHTNDQPEDGERLLMNQLTSVWQGHVETDMAINLLASLGYQQAERCYQLIHAFRHAPRCRRLTQAARLRLDRFMVLLLRQLTDMDHAESVLLNVIHLLENIVGRSAYLALLTENLCALHELLYWFAESPFITELLVTHPFLLELLLANTGRWQTPTRHQLEQQLTQQLALCEDDEAREDSLRQFKLTQWLSVARAELRGQVSAQRAAGFLADLAQAVLAQVVLLAARQLNDRYPAINAVVEKLAIIAYGKLGSREMNYNSDLDLVFLHTCPPDQEAYVIRLTQKIIHMLTARSQFGILYQVDTRLRPSGESGLLVSRLSAFVNYQQASAWTWEHQALIRARIIAGDSRSRAVFRQLKKDVLSMSRDEAMIRTDVQGMREKIKQQLGSEGVKYAPGALIDLEFFVQYLVLISPIPSISRYTHTSSLLRQLASHSVLTSSECSVLQRALRAYHRALHAGLLNPEKQTDWEQEREAVLALLQNAGWERA
ncbi:bifunctional [glutamate--ammonia ligase]-adenylyl-L-tyrosine phosphorylase/[glutamate--ammonia-ligase] adenylyltransferase [Legionella sp. CNM-4043-24]|uniref:bifunctional [glutamate--ammonia ligase]-adenylyl-L-tyrosine phosphorylase/[glutamate--ammonia-ligase] adenylyltransferase n=1 Tax=Legionella sp. CNM-4043-24 TaxID=3421646 RepID=UPI00403AD8A6